MGIFFVVYRRIHSADHRESSTETLSAFASSTEMGRLERSNPAIQLPRPVPADKNEFFGIGWNILQYTDLHRANRSLAIIESETLPHQYVLLCGELNITLRTAESLHLGRILCGIMLSRHQMLSTEPLDTVRPRIAHSYDFFFQSWLSYDRTFVREYDGSWFRS